MSAWDITGAIVWTPLTVFCLTGATVMGARTARTAKTDDAGGLVTFILGAAACGAPAAFCIARLFGAHL